MSDVPHLVTPVAQHKLVCSIGCTYAADAAGFKTLAG